MICCFCSRHEEEADVIKQGWVPSFWCEPKEWEGPVCLECTARYLDFNTQIQDFQLKAGLQVPALAIPLTKHPNLE